MTTQEIMESLHAKDFLLLRQGRIVIKDAPDREHLLRIQRLEWMCPVQEVFYRRAGLAN